VIVATGMASLGEIEYVTNIFQNASNENVVLLHCVSNYPCSDASINLRAMNTLQTAFQLPVGFSDHSDGSLAASLSVAFGAKVIEKHFTLDKTMEGPDHRASSTPNEFSDLVKNVRRAEITLGNAKKHCQEEERQMASVSRKSIVLSRDCSKGTIIEADHLTLRRPGTGILSHHLSGFIGGVLKSDLPAGAMLKWSDLKDIK
jgi:sialic acid synthase SpsE